MISACKKPSKTLFNAQSNTQSSTLLPMTGASPVGSTTFLKKRGFHSEKHDLISVECLSKSGEINNQTQSR